MNVIIETDRLFLRTFTNNDAQLIYELNSDLDVTRYTHDPVKDFNHSKETLKQGILLPMLYTIMVAGLTFKTRT